MSAVIHCGVQDSPSTSPQTQEGRCDKLVVSHRREGAGSWDDLG